jgi:hypothetical protein
MKRAPKAWTEAQLKKAYGEEYPRVVMSEGIRYPLQRERKFARLFSEQDKKGGVLISRFMDGSAGITLAELSQNWSKWERVDKVDFCQGCSWLAGQEDFPDLLRYVMKHGQLDDWSGIALQVARELPQNEAFRFLNDALQAAGPGRGSNLTQGLAHTKHPAAASVLCDHLHATMSHPLVWEDDRFLNWIAYDAITCINHLIEELGAAPSDFEPQVRRLSEHVCERNRRSCVNFLSKHYPWLKKGPSD